MLPSASLLVCISPVFLDLVAVFWILPLPLYTLFFVCLFVFDPCVA